MFSFVFLYYICINLKLPCFKNIQIIVNIVSEPPRRERLRHINSISDAVRLLRSCKKILVLTGAGVRIFLFTPEFIFFLMEI